VASVVKVYRFEFWLIFRYNSLPTKFPVEPIFLLGRKDRELKGLGDFGFFKKDWKSLALIHFNKVSGFSKYPAVVIYN